MFSWLLFFFSNQAFVKFAKTTEAKDTMLSTYLKMKQQDVRFVSEPMC